MNMRGLYEAGKTVVSVAIATAFLGWCTFSIGNDAVRTYTQWDEPRYLMPARYHPLLRNLPGISRSAYDCYSPARCEPSGKPSPQYFVLLTATEVREWGFDPSHEIPVKGDPFI